MAVSLSAHCVSDLCLGKPALRPLHVSATVGDALVALKSIDDVFISVWDCRHHQKPNRTTEEAGRCRCVGKLSVADVVCFLCKNENLLSSSAALQVSVSEILPKDPGAVINLEPSSSLLEAIDHILEGAQNLVVPLKSRPSNRFTRTKHHQKPYNTVHNNGVEFCWLTQEDIVRFLLNSIGFFSPIISLSIESLGIISTDVSAISYHSPASSELAAIHAALMDQTSVAVVDGDGILIGEISPVALASCGKTLVAAAAVTTLSAGELMAYIDLGGAPSDLVKVVKARLEEMNMEKMLKELRDLSSPMASSGSSSSDEEFSPSPTTILPRSARPSSFSSRIFSRAESIVCYPRSSLVAVLIQAISHRVNYVWVTDEDYSLVGIVTFCNMLRVFRNFTC